MNNSTMTLSQLGNRLYNINNYKLELSYEYYCIFGAYLAKVTFINSENISEELILDFCNNEIFPTWSGDSETRYCIPMTYLARRLLIGKLKEVHKTEKLRLEGVSLWET